MENRIRRLEFEEARADKMAHEAEIRATNMINNRKRHFEVSCYSLTLFCSGIDRKKELNNGQENS